MIDKKTLNVIEETAIGAALGAGTILKDLWDKPRQVSQKGFRDIVTDADLAAQEFIVGMIRDRFPEHGFLAEEEDSALPAFAPIRWVIDPLDGTTNYSRQFPNFCTSIAAIDENDDSIVGVIYAPIFDELYVANAGNGATLNNTPLQVSQRSTLAEAIPCFDWSRSPEKRQQIINLVSRIAPKVTTVRTFGSAALCLAWVAAGRLDCYVNFSLSAWDVAAGRLLIQEAGGKLTNNAGNSWQLNDSGCIASNGNLHSQIVDLVPKAISKQ